MAISSPLNFSFLHLALLLFIIITLLMQAEGRPSPKRSDAQVLQDLFGVKISTLVFPPSEVIEGSGNSPSPLLQKGRDSGTESHGGATPAFLDFLRHQRKLHGRSRKGVARGCFGMKMDRIGVISGLGC